MNSINLVGIITNDLKYFNDGKTVVFQISDRNNGKRQFVDCVAFNNTADYIGKLCQKNTVVSVSGVLSLEPYTNKEGKEVKQTKVIVNIFEVVKDGKVYDKESAPSKSSYQAPKEVVKEETVQPVGVDINDEDLPF
jgi:single-strand DNA-binding protein